MITLVLEVIKKVKEVEEQAELLITGAQKESVSMIKNANIEGQEIYHTMVLDAKEKGNQMMLGALTVAEKDVTKILEKGSAQQEEIVQHSKEQMKNAINLVIERIVDMNGNR